MRIKQRKNRCKEYRTVKKKKISRPKSNHINDYIKHQTKIFSKTFPKGKLEAHIVSPVNVNNYLRKSNIDLI